MSLMKPVTVSGSYFIMILTYCIAISTLLFYKHYLLSKPWKQEELSYHFGSSALLRFSTFLASPNFRLIIFCLFNFIFSFLSLNTQPLCVSSSHWPRDDRLSLSANLSVKMLFFFSRQNSFFLFFKISFNSPARFLLKCHASHRLSQCPSFQYERFRLCQFLSISFNSPFIFQSTRYRRHYIYS